MNLQLNRAGNTVYVSGEIEYFKPVRRSVVVDGVTYYNNYNDIITEDISNLMDDDCLFAEYLGIQGLFDLNIRTAIMGGYVVLPQRFSENNYANIYHNINYYKLFPPIVKGMSHGKGRGMWDDIVYKGNIDIMVLSYGFNNNIWVQVSMYDFLRMETEHRRQVANIDRIEYYFKRKYNFSVKENITTDKLIRFFNQKINEKHETRKQQIATSLYL